MKAKTVLVVDDEPVIVFTAKPDMAQFALKNGANDVIAKPFKPDRVVTTIETMLSKSYK